MAPNLYVDDECEVNHFLNGEFLLEHEINGVSVGLTQRYSYFGSSTTQGVIDPRECECPDVDSPWYNEKEQWNAGHFLTVYCQNNECRIQVSSSIERRLIYVGEWHLLGWSPYYNWQFRTEPLTEKPTVGKSYTIPFRTFGLYYTGTNPNGSTEWITCPGTAIEEPDDITITFL